MDQQARRRKASGAASRQRLCTLECGTRTPAAILDICARGAFLETSERPPLGTKVALHHATAGTVDGEVSAHAITGLAVSFVPNARAVAFTLAVIAAGMSRTAP